MQEYKRRVKLPEMARLLSRCVKQFRADVKKYSIPYLSLGRSKLFIPEEVENFLAQNALQNLITSDANSEQVKNNQKARKNYRKSKLETRAKEHYRKLLGLS